MEGEKNMRNRQKKSSMVEGNGGMLGSERVVLTRLDTKKDRNESRRS